MYHHTVPSKAPLPASALSPLVPGSPPTCLPAFQPIPSCPSAQGPRPLARLGHEAHEGWAHALPRELASHPGVGGAGVDPVIPAQSQGEQGGAPSPAPQDSVGPGSRWIPGVVARRDFEVPWPGGGTGPLSHSDRPQACHGSLGTRTLPAASLPLLLPTRLPITSPFCLGSLLHPCTGSCLMRGAVEPEPKKRESLGQGHQCSRGAHTQTH